MSVLAPRERPCQHVPFYNPIASSTAVFPSALATVSTSTLPFPPTFAPFATSSLAVSASPCRTACMSGSLPLGIRRVDVGPVRDEQPRHLGLPACQLPAESAAREMRGRKGDSL
ncbi:hypothetical protein NLG97_g4361 [Lecanicillium saksenae]|uniref:Uncharacterized protein n=1 Tax=Lecanicillium saksenae TaxID=468837 RepID=A0ACC1QYT4_9HYPO|nr:hypothetical protein NLG97_g4361 [Lecanicillium saksenae]